MSAAIEVRDLTKSYGDTHAVRGITFSVEPGEVFCLLGPNGAGKTTTTEILEGYRQRTGGDVAVLGVDPAERRRDWLARIGIVLQACGIQQDLTVTEVLDTTGRWYPRQIPTGEILEMVELGPKAHTRVRDLSGGQQRRLDVGLALVGDPDLVFLDEPTTGFDPSARRSSWAMVRRLAERGTTVLLTTHFMDEAEALADRIAVVAEGRIVATGTAATLGGRDRAPTRVEATIDAPLDPADLPDLGPLAERPTCSAGRLVLRTNDATATLHRLTRWALDTGHRLGGLTVAAPSLEDTYLELTR